MILSTSNHKKFTEYTEYIPDLEVVQGPDIKEVKGTAREVILHKAKDMGGGFIVEDTILLVNDIEVVDIRWKLHELKEGDKVSWIVNLGYNDGQSVHLYSGKIDGVITLDDIAEGSDFDPYFIPDGSALSLSELGEEKKNFSARAEAIKNFIEGDSTEDVLLFEIPEWTGEYQNS